MCLFCGNGGKCLCRKNLEHLSNYKNNGAFVLKPCSLVGEMSYGVDGLLKCKLKFSEM